MIPLHRNFGHCSIAVLCVALWLTGCASIPSPNPALVVWNEPYPWLAANQHADRISGGAFEIADTGSMEPFLVGGDFVVGDFAAKWEGIKPGDLLVYDPNWADASVPLVCHLAVERSGDGWVMTGIANQYSESGSRSLMLADYRARVVAVYTARNKP